MSKRKLKQLLKLEKLAAIAEYIKKHQIEMGI